MLEREAAFQSAEEIAEDIRAMLNGEYSNDDDDDNDDVDSNATTLPYSPSDPMSPIHYEDEHCLVLACPPAPPSSPV